MHDLLLLGPMAAALAAYLIHRFRFPAERLGLVDRPGGRKQHGRHVPLVGGVGMFVAFALVALLLDMGLQPYRPLFAGLALLLITGVLDDLRDLTATEKIVLQLLAGLVLVFWGGLVIEHLGMVPLLGRLELGWLAIPFTLLCVVGLVNAINMIDGIDGLAGGVVLVMLFWLAVVGIAGGGGTATALAVLLACSVAGFLAFNLPQRWRRQATAFMGDSGSTMLGFALAWLAIDITFRAPTGVPPVTIAWILALPVFDTIALMTRRLAKGRSPMSPDREHLHHVFERAGFSRATTCYVLIAVAFVFGAVGVGGWWLGIPESMLWPPLLVLLVLHWLFVHRAWRAMRLLRRVGSQAAEERGRGS